MLLRNIKKNLSESLPKSDRASWEGYMFSERYCSNHLKDSSSSLLDLTKYKIPERQLELLAGSGKVEMVLARQAVGTAAGEREIDSDEDMAHLLLGKRCKRETGNARK